MKDTFEEFLAEKCDSHTNNDPAGFERWLEQLDVDELMLYGQEYGEKRYLEGKKDELDEVEQKIINPLKEKLL